MILIIWGNIAQGFHDISLSWDLSNVFLKKLDWEEGVAGRKDDRKTQRSGAIFVTFYQGTYYQMTYQC